MLYNRKDFLEFFDTKETLQEDIGMIRYKVTSKAGLSLSIFMIICENTICINFSSPSNDLISLSSEKIIYIKFDQKNSDKACFFFYQKGKDEPVVTVFVKPNLAVHLNLEQIPVLV